MKTTLINLIVLISMAGILQAGWRDPVQSERAMVVTAEPQATRIGVKIMEQGGNAIDAAAAVGFALAVTYPQAGNIGGGGFMMIRMADGRYYALDYREKAPAAAGRDMYLDAEGNVIEKSSTIGYLASGVPGSVAGLYTAHQKFGRLPWAKVVQPAIELADQGFAIDRSLSESLAHYLDRFDPFPASRRIFTREGKSLSAGDTLVQKDLAETLKYIRDRGAEGFYRGPVAEQIARDMAENNGLITTDDLKNYEAEWREPVSFSYRGYRIYSMPPPSSGGVLLAVCLNTLENINPRALGHNSSPLIHFWIETLRQIYADRSEQLGDPDFYDVPVEELLSKAYAQSIYRRINAGYARSSVNTLPYGKESGETTHFSIADPEGNVVSNTTTLNGSYGSGVVIAKTGILMNNEMDDFSIKPGYPNIYGLIGGEANAIEPEKRMLSSMTPTIVERNNEPWLILGSPGGGRIITAVAQVISNVIDHRMNIREAVELPRFHHQWLPDETYYEDPGFAQDVIFNLEKKGHKLRKTNAVGCVQAILRDTDQGIWTGWSDPRRNGSCEGF